MIAFFANIFGYLLNFLYDLIGNYGIAIILFSIIVKLIMLPLSIKQQKSMKKNSKIQAEMKEIQFKYKNDAEKLNQETIALYKREKMSPFSGCLSAIVQIVLLFSVFYLVRSPLTYMKKIDTDTINQYVTEIKDAGLSTSTAYPEIEIIRESENLRKIEKGEFVKEENTDETNENSSDENIVSTNEVSENIEQKNEDEKSDETPTDTTKNVDEKIDKISINMNFFGLDLSKVPTQNLSDWTVYIIPLLYVISSFASMRLTTSMQEKKNKGETTENDNKTDEMDAMAAANKNMSLFMPIMSISIAVIAPLGLALYWLINNVLMICERLVLDKVLKDKEE